MTRTRPTQVSNTKKAYARGSGAITASWRFLLFARKWRSILLSAILFVCGNIHISRKLEVASKAGAAAIPTEIESVTTLDFFSFSLKFLKETKGEGSHKDTASKKGSIIPPAGSASRPSAVSILNQQMPFNVSNVIMLADDQHLVKSCHTVVTAYYRVPSKHNPERYLRWMENMLSLQDPMVIFTQTEFVTHIAEFRSHALNRTVIVPLSLYDLPIGAAFPTEFWEDQLNRDPEKDIHRSFQLFWIWLSKSWFVSATIQMNFFDSGIFVWSDIGCFRKPNYNFKTMVLHPETVPVNEVLQMATRKVKPPKDALFNDKFNQSSHLYHSGSQFAGYRTVLLTFHEYFLHTIDQFLQHNMTIAEDQAVLQSTCLLHPDICAYVERKHVDDNAYFGLRYILHYGGNTTKYWRMNGGDKRQTHDNSVFTKS